MTGEELRALILSHPEAYADHPFGPDVAVYKVRGKMFALVPYDSPLRVSLKCDPTLAEILRAQYHAVQPGYHLNKRHWNTITLEGAFSGEPVSDDEVRDWIAQSYQLVVSGLPKRAQRQLLGSNPD